MPQLINTLDFTGLYDSMEVVDTTQAVVELNAVELLKAANKPVWLADGSNLQYTITARNLDERAPDATDPGLPLTNVTLVDTIDLEIATLVEGSLTLTVGSTVVTEIDFDYEDGVLTVRVGTIPPGQTATLTFLVERAE